MNDSTTSPEGPNPSGFCMCGCGQMTAISPVNRRSRGWVKGTHQRYIKGHSATRKGPYPTFVPVNASGLCQCGCGRPAPIATRTNKRRGLKAGMPYRYIRNHRPQDDRPEYLADSETGCWVWQRHINVETGYGQFGRCALAHRVVWERVNGPIPAGMHLDHLCKNRACVNPAHLEVVTPAVNAQRSDKSKLNREQVERMRRLFDSGMKRSEIARLFGVHWCTASAVVRGQSWK